MYIVWRKRPITSNRKAELFVEYFNGESHDIDGKLIKRGRQKDRGGAPWKPLYCIHRGPGRIAWTPFLMHAERVNGKPRQKLLQRLPTIRTCCIKDKFIRAAWWHDVKWWLKYYEEMDTGPAGWFIRRDRRAIVAKLREVVPPPTKAGLRDFTVYRLEKEAEQTRFLDELKDRLSQQAAEQRCHWAEEQARQCRQQEDELRREWEKTARWFGIPNPFDESCWTVLGLPRTSTVDEVKVRYRELVLLHHPDRSGDPEMFKRVQTAYEDTMARLTPAA